MSDVGGDLVGGAVDLYRAVHGLIQVVQLAILMALLRWVRARPARRREDSSPPRFLDET